MNRVSIRLMMFSNTDLREHIGLRNFNAHRIDPHVVVGEQALERVHVAALKRLTDLSFQTGNSLLVKIYTNSFGSSGKGHPRRTTWTVARTATTRVGRT